MVSSLMTSNDSAPEPPAECLGFVRRGTPAMQEVEASLARFGYAHSEPGTISDSEIAAAGLLVVRGLVVDCVHGNTPEAWAAVRGDENLALLRRLPR